MNRIERAEEESYMSLFASHNRCSGISMALGPAEVRTGVAVVFGMENKAAGAGE